MSECHEHHHEHHEYSNVFPRVSGRLGNIIDLNVTFYRNGIPTDPFAIRKVSIYRSAVQPENLITEFMVVSPLHDTYPSPLLREVDSAGHVNPGVFHLYWQVPANGIPVPDIFFDVWSFFATDPGISPGITGEGGSIGDITGGPILEDESKWQSFCQKFWLYNDGFFMDAGLETLRIGFEPIDCKFHTGEIRTLEVGMMPLPLYDYDYNFVAPIIPHLTATISISTDHNELIIEDDPMRLGLRQGSYRSNPFVLQYTLNTAKLLRGSYKYQVTIRLPNGESRVSPAFNLQVS